MRADSRMPNGAMSFMKESILDGLADLRAESEEKFPQSKLIASPVTYTSTVQLLVLMSNIFPPNWWAK